MADTVRQLKLANDSVYEVTLSEPRRVLHLPLDMKDFGEFLFVNSSLWIEPAGVTINPDEMKRVVDALWAHGHHAIADRYQGFDVLLRAVPGRVFVGTYFTGPNTGYATLLQPGRTLRVDVTMDYVRGFTKATLLRETARWLYPNPGPVNDVDWPGLSHQFITAERDAFYKDRWSFMNAVR